MRGTTRTSPGGQITGNLDGDLTVQESDVGSGGEADFTIDGNATGNITIPTIPATGSLSVGGDVSGTITVDVIKGGFSMTGNLLGSGAINVTNGIDNPLFEVTGEVSTGAVITIADMVGPGGLQFNAGGALGELEFAGTLVLQSGLGEYQGVNILGNLTGVVDLNGADVAGALDLDGGGSGSIVNGGTITAIVDLGFGTAGTVFTGTATFAGVGVFGTIGSLNDGDLCDGTYFGVPCR